MLNTLIVGQDWRLFLYSFVQQFALFFIPGVFFLQMCVALSVWRISFSKMERKEEKVYWDYMSRPVIKRLIKIKNRGHFKNLRINTYTKCLDN